MKKPMTKEELQDILSKTWYREISADDAFDLIWAEPFEGETEYKDYVN